MGSTFAVVCLLFSLSAKGYCISCQQCVTSLAPNCTGVSVICPTGYVCESRYTNTTISGLSTKILARSCSPPSNCNITGSMTIPGGTVQISTTCCTSDNCYPPTPTFKAATNNNATNSTSSVSGVTCRSCATVNSDWCYTSDTMRCSGNETMCIMHTLKITGPQGVTHAVRGCATPSYCALTSQSFTTSDLSLEEKYSCSNGGISINVGPLTPTILFFFLTKYIL